MDDPKYDWYSELDENLNDYDPNMPAASTTEQYNEDIREKMKKGKGDGDDDDKSGGDED